MVVQIEDARFSEQALTEQVMGTLKTTTMKMEAWCSEQDTKKDPRRESVRRLYHEVVKVHTMLRASFDSVSVHETCRAFENEVWETSGSTDEYARNMRAQIHSIAKKGRMMLQQRDGDNVSSHQASPRKRHAPTSSPEMSMKQMQQAHLRRALSNSWVRAQRKNSRFRWAAPVNANEESHVQTIQRSSNAEILQSIRNLYYNQLIAYEEQLQLSLQAEHRDWVAFDLSVVQSFLITLSPQSDTVPAHHNIQSLHTQIEKVLREKVLFDYMWEMEHSKSFHSTELKASYLTTS